MHVLHVHWQPPAQPGDEGGLLFWGETTDVAPPGKRDRRVKKPQAHAFSAPADRIEEVLQSVARPEVEGSQRGVRQRGVRQRLTLWLPTLRRGPQPSPALLHDWDMAEEQGRTLLPSTVEGLWLPPASGFDVLASLLAREAHLLPAVRLGEDLRYWQRAATLVLEALARQKVRPALIEVEPGAVYHARWLPVLDGPKDAPRLAALAQAMPTVCRAEATDPETADPDEAPAPRALLEAFLNTMTDALARRWGRAADLNVSARGQQPVHHWLRALRASDPEVEGAPAPLEHLYGSYRAWLRNLHVAGDPTFRIAFRMEAPGQQDTSGDAAGDASGDAAAWTLHFLLQARDDPSLLVPAAQVWHARGGALSTLDRTFKQPQEKLLAGLGYAARLFEPLRRGLQSAAPEHVELTAREAYAFLRDVAPLLEQSGFGVLVPPWWNEPGTRLGVRLELGARAQSVRQRTADAAESTGHLSLDHLVRYRWALSLGETTLTREEFDALVDLKTPLVQIRGQWVQLDPDQIEAAIRFWEEQDLEGEKKLRDVLQTGLEAGLGGAEAARGLPVDEVAFEGKLRDWMDRLQGREELETLPPPDGLEATLRPYQAYGFAWLDFMRRSGMGTILADDMGLGKTIQALAMLLRVKEQDGLSRPALVVCPTSVVTNWEREARRFTPALRTVVHQGPDRLRGEAFARQAREADVILTSYALARRDGAFLAEVDWRGIVLDEAQNVKNPNTKQARVIRGLPAGFRVALTGTPVENRLSELWSIMHFLNPGFLGPRERFRKTFSRPIERYNDSGAARRLRRLTQPFILRRLKTDPSVIQDLPDKQEMKVYCPLSEEQATLYEAVVRDTLGQVEEADGIQRKGLVLSMMTKLKQVCNHPVQFLHQSDAYTPAEDKNRSGKLDRLTEMLEVVASEGDRALLFTQYTEMGRLLRRYAQEQLGLATLFLHGGTPGHKRDEIVRRFQDDPDGPPLFILSLKAGGTGLNLTRANHVFHFDRWWNPAVEDQATDRAFRIGQHRNVLVHKFVCVGTLEERIDEMIESKKALAERIIGAAAEWLTELSTDDLRELVTLRREMVE